MKWCLRTCKHSSCLLLVMSLGKLADTKCAAQECQLGEAATPVAALCSSSQWHSSINGAVERNLSGKRSFSRSVFTRFFREFLGLCVLTQRYCQTLLRTMIIEWSDALWVSEHVLTFSHTHACTHALPDLILWCRYNSAQQKQKQKFYP